MLAYFAKYLIAAIIAELIATYHDARLAGNDRMNKKASPSQTLLINTVRLEIALLGHLFTIAMKDWVPGLLTKAYAGHIECSKIRFILHFN